MEPAATLPLDGAAVKPCRRSGESLCGYAEAHTSLPGIENAKRLRWRRGALRDRSKQESGLGQHHGLVVELTAIVTGTVTCCPFEALMTIWL